MAADAQMRLRRVIGLRPGRQSPSAREFAAVAACFARSHGTTALSTGRSRSQRCEFFPRCERTPHVAVGTPRAFSVTEMRRWTRTI